MKRIYFDYAATTPVDPRVLRAMQPYFNKQFGNPGSLHTFGQEAITAIDQSREIIAKELGVDFREIIFTSSATEANNLALRGVVKQSKRANANMVISSLEHESIIETARDLGHEGIDVRIVPVDAHGVLDRVALRTMLDDHTILVSIMYANNEVGTMQSLAEVAKIIRGTAPHALFHTDAAQAFQYCNSNIGDLGVDMMTISSHKMYGPKGAGALYVRAKSTKGVTALAPLLTGGGQEFGIRSGTENVPAIVGFAKALEIAGKMRTKEAKRVGALRVALWQGIQKIDPKASVNGFPNVTVDSPTLPNILNVYFPNRSAEDIITLLDLRGVAVSSGSACRSRAATPSHVIAALGHTALRANASIRFSLGRGTTRADITGALRILRETFSDAAS
jgi:cysteine desulfurase